MLKPEQGDACVVVAEDDEDDMMLMRMAWQDIGLPDCLLFLPNGEETLRYLQGQPPYESSQRPSLILLDWHLPKVDGRQVWAYLRADPDLCRIPVVVLTAIEPVEAQREGWGLGKGIEWQSKAPTYSALKTQLETIWNNYLKMNQVENGLEKHIT